MKAIYRNDRNETLEFDLVRDGEAYFLEIEPGIRVPLSQKINDVALGLLLLANDLPGREELIQDIHEKIACLGYAELDGFLDQDGLRPLFGNDFADAPESQVREFSRELNEKLSSMTGTEFQFADIDIELQHIFSNKPQ